MNKSLYTLLFLTCSFQYNYTKLVKGDINAAAGTTFSFNVGFAQFDFAAESSSPRFWTATNDPNITTMPDETKQYGLSFITQTASYLESKYFLAATPMTNPENATIFSFNNSLVTVTTAANPLWGAIFSQFDVSNHKPIFVLTTTLNLLYSVHNIERFASDSTKPNITELLVHDFGTGQEVHAIRGYNETIYAAYSLGAFTDSATPNIALLQRTVGKVDGKDTPQPCLQLYATLPLSVSNDAIKAGAGQPDLASFGPSVIMDTAMRGLYLGLQATAAATGSAAGITQILTTSTTDSTTKVTTYNLQLMPVAPSSVLTAGFDTAVSASSGNTIRATSITHLQSSTNLPYLVVAQDNAAGPETIYALPLTSNGMIADFTSINTVFGTTQPIFVSRYFSNIISDPQQINPANSAIINQIRVGGASTLPIDAGNSLSKMFVVGDTVFAVIGGQYSATQAPGTYASQAIFAPEGHIVAWSPWKRALGTDKQMNYSFVDFKSLTGMYVAAQAPSATPQFNSIYQTTFDTSSNFTPFLTVAQNAPNYIQGLFDFNASTPGFNSQLSLLIATAYEKLTIGQTGANNGTAFGIKTMNSSDVLSFDSNQMGKKQALVAAEIAHNGNDHWIFAAGSLGLLVLTDNTTGVSWTGNLANIAGLDAGQTWKKVGNFSFIKKLVWDTTSLYVLTNSHLYKIDLDPTKFNANPTTPLNANIVATASQLESNSSFLDVIIDTGYCLLATTNGLYKIDGSIQKIMIPQGLPAVSQLIAISPDFNPQRSFKQLSNLYILNNTFATQQARIYRFAIQEGVLTPLPDMFAAQPASTSKGLQSAFIIFNNYISSYFTDGAWNIACSYFTGPNQPSYTHATPFVLQIFAGVRSGLSSSQIIMKSLAAYAPLTFLNDTENSITNLLAMVKETTSGAIIASGDFPAHTNA